MNLKSNKAITLVALIITIIILLILAGVSLSMVLGENGLINKAQSSVDKYKESSENEQKLLNSIENYMDLQLKSPGTKVDVPDGWNKDTVDAVLDDKKNIIPVPKNFYYVGGNLDNGVIISDDPADAYDGTTDKTTWEYTTSLVGNQFVWIPCTEEEYHKTDWGSAYVKGNYTENGQSEQEIQQIKKYKGLYVGRYEAGLDESIAEYTSDQLQDNVSSPGYNVIGKPTSKAGKVPWTFLSYNNAMPNAKNMYTNTKQENYIVSELVTETQWDVMLNKFIGKVNCEGITILLEDMLNSKKWGNHYDNNIVYTGRRAILYQKGNYQYLTPFGKSETVQETGENVATLWTTGASKITEMYHTYDVAGNVWEITEKNENERIIRGGSFSNGSNMYTVCYRNVGTDIKTVHYDVGFRVVLYIK